MYVHTGELLGQPSRKPAAPDLPDWARIYLKTVRRMSLDKLAPYVALFETITFHPYPLISNQELGKVFDKLLSTNTNENIDPGSMFLSELERIRDARLFQHPSFSKLHENHRKLWQDALIGFTQLKPKDLETILIEWILRPPDYLPGGGAMYRGSPLWKLGKRFVQDKLPKELSTRVIKSPWYMQDAIFIQLGLDLQRMADTHQKQDANFRKKVDLERKARVKRPKTSKP